MKKAAAFIILFMFIITALVPNAFAVAVETFSYDESLLTDEHYPGQLYEYEFKPDADLKDITMTFNITSGSNLIQDLKFTPNDKKYILSFYVSPSVTGRKTVDFEVTCRVKSNSNYKSTIQNTFKVGYKDTKYINYDGNNEFDIDNTQPIYVFNDNINNAKLIFENGSYFEVDINKSSEKTNLAYTKYAVADIANNTDANLFFMNFIGKPTFSTTGTLYLYAPDAKYLYSYNGTALTQLNATIENDYIKFNTRTLGNYIASDKPLSGSSVSNSSTSSSKSSSSQSVSSSSSSSRIILSSSGSSQAVSSPSSKSSSLSKSQTAAGGVKMNPGTGIQNHT